MVVDDLAVFVALHEGDEGVAVDGFHLSEAPLGGEKRDYALQERKPKENET